MRKINTKLAVSTAADTTSKSSSCWFRFFCCCIPRKKTAIPVSASSSSSTPAHSDSARTSVPSKLLGESTSTPTLTFVRADNGAPVNPDDMEQPEGPAIEIIDTIPLPGSRRSSTYEAWSRGETL